MIAIEVKVEFPRGFDPSDEVNKQRLQKWAPAVGSQAALSSHIRRRMRRRGESVQRFPGYSSKGRRNVASRYPIAAGGRQRQDGVVVYDSSQAFHAGLGVRRGSFDVSGGMWRGLTIRASGQSKATATFRGRSIGQSTFTTKTGRFRPAGRKVSNTDKAAAVLDSKDVNVLSMFNREVRSLADGIAESAGFAIAPSFGISVLETRGGASNARLQRDIVRAIRRKRRTIA